MDLSVKIYTGDIIIYNNNLWHICTRCSEQQNLLLSEPCVVMHKDVLLRSIIHAKHEKETVMLSMIEFTRLIAEKELNILRFSQFREEEFNLLDIPMCKN